MIAEREGYAEGEKIAVKDNITLGRIKSRAQPVRARLYAGALQMQISPGVSEPHKPYHARYASGWAARAPCAA